jgi:hypothetical protein
MEEKKYYSLIENGAELQVIASLPEAALEWEINPEHRTVSEVAPHHESQSATASWVVVREVPKDELLDVLKMSRV